jgi:hypothetical protein
LCPHSFDPSIVVHVSSTVIRSRTRQADKAVEHHTFVLGFIVSVSVSVSHSKQLDSFISTSADEHERTVNTLDTIRSTDSR